MAQILIRNLDPKVVEKLKEQAAANGRSLEADLRIFLERESWIGASGEEAHLKPAARSRKRAGRSRRK